MNFIKNLYNIFYLNQENAVIVIPLSIKSTPLFSRSFNQSANLTNAKKKLNWPAQRSTNVATPVLES